MASGPFHIRSVGPTPIQSIMPLNFPREHTVFPFGGACYSNILGRSLQSPPSSSPPPTRPQPPPVHDGEGEAIGSGRCRHGRRRRAEEPAAAYRGGPGTWSACSLARSCVDRFQPAAEYLPLRASRRWPDGAERCRPRAAMRASDLGEHGFQRVPPASGAMAASPAGCQCGCFLDTLLA
jgi:hypothetical protein